MFSLNPDFFEILQKLSDLKYFSIEIHKSTIYILWRYLYNKLVLKVDSFQFLISDINELARLETSTRLPL